MVNRVHIDAPSGVIEIEGEREFVEGALAKFLPLIEQAGFGSRPRSQSANQELEDEIPANGDKRRQKMAARQRLSAIGE